MDLVHTSTSFQINHTLNNHTRRHVRRSTGCLKNIGGGAGIHRFGEGGGDGNMTEGTELRLMLLQSSTTIK